MKYALITPPEGFCLHERFNLGYHFVLPQYLDDPEYLMHYKALSAKGHFILMDNGAAELGEGIDDKKLVDAAQLIGADEVVMPDVLDDARGSLERTHQAVHYFPKRMRAMCPQGETWDEWEHCAAIMLNMGCVTLCVAKRYELLPGGRPHALRLIHENGWHLDHHIHLLGCSRKPLEEIRAAKKIAPWVRGIDTAAPIAFAQNGASLRIAEEHYSLDWDAHFDCTLAHENVGDVIEACGG